MQQLSQSVSNAAAPNRVVRPSVLEVWLFADATLPTKLLPLLYNNM
jgi:hypothetical protein